MTLKNNRAPLLYYVKFVHHFKSIGEAKLELQSGNAQFGSKLVIFLSCVTLKFGRWPWKTIRHLFYTTFSKMCSISKPLLYSTWRFSLETLNLGQNWLFFVPRDLENWWMTLKNNRAPLLSNTKHCASFRHHMWIQTGVTVRKRLNGVMTSVTLTFNLLPRPFPWTSCLSMLITPENFRMIRWQEHCQKGVTDGRTDGWTDRQK